MGYAYLYFLRRVPCLSPLPPLPSALSRPLSVPNVLHKYVFPTESPILTPFVMLAVVPARAWMQQLLACYFVYEECADSNRHLTGLRVQGYNPNRNATAALQLPIGLKRPCRRAGSNRKRYYIRHPTTLALVYAKCADSYTHLTQPHATAALQLPIGLKRPCRRAGSNRKRFYISHPTPPTAAAAAALRPLSGLKRPSRWAGPTH